ncbi:MAG: hypothetical protein C0623_08795 [Desulfuromonas sp.]|nr:MAG: hypothetical protein C0623_08795 [Desulfuromonas sp.]
MAIISFENIGLGSITLNFKLEEGMSLALSGVEEVGTQKVLDTILGFSLPVSGQLLVTGEDSSRFSQKQWRQFRGTVGVVSESFGLVANLKVWENVLLPVSFHSGISSIDEQKEVVAKALDLSGFGGDPLAAAGALSRFERKQVLLARAFAIRPVLMIYDHYLNGHSYNEKQDLIRTANHYVTQNADISCLYFVDDAEGIAALDHLHAFVENQEGNYVR